VGLNSLKGLNLTNVYPNNNNKNKKKKNNNNKVKSKPLELRSRVKSAKILIWALFAPFTADDGSKLSNSAEIEATLRCIKSKADSRPSRGPGVGALTCDNRDLWYTNRQLLLELGTVADIQTFWVKWIYFNKLKININFENKFFKKKY
jgi:hypothetical protein